MKKLALVGKNGIGKFAIVDDEDYIVVVERRWYLHAKGYACITVAGKTLPLHRLLMQAKPGQLVDHKNLDRLDNRRCNLRFATWRNNLKNSAKRGAHRYKGVYFDRQKNTWHVKIRHEDTYISIGRFKDEYDAAYVYDQVAIQLRGEWAYTNLPIDS